MEGLIRRWGTGLRRKCGVRLEGIAVLMQREEEDNKRPKLEWTPNDANAFTGHEMSSWNKTFSCATKRDRFASEQPVDQPADQPAGQTDAITVSQTRRTTDRNRGAVLEVVSSCRLHDLTSRGPWRSCRCHGGKLNRRQVSSLWRRRRRGQSRCE